MRTKLAHSIPLLLTLMLLLAAASCAEESPGPKPGPTNSQHSDSVPAGSAMQVRESLSRLDPCRLLGPPQTASEDHTTQADPNKCTIATDAGYVSVTIGVPFDKEARAKSKNPANRLKSFEIDGLRAYKSSYSDSQSCDITFAVGAYHGIAVESDDHCSTSEDAATAVAEQLQSNDPPLRAQSDPQNHTACGLLKSAASADAGSVEGPGGLSTCSSETDPNGDVVGLSITYTDIGLDAFSPEDGRRTKVAGSDVFLKTEPSDCVGYMILGKTSATYAAGPNVQLSISGETCDSVTSLLTSAIGSWDTQPPVGEDFSSYLVRIN